MTKSMIQMHSLTTEEINFNHYLMEDLTDNLGSIMSEEGTGSINCLEHLKKINKLEQENQILKQRIQELESILNLRSNTDLQEDQNKNNEVLRYEKWCNDQHLDFSINNLEVYLENFQANTSSKKRSYIKRFFFKKTELPERKEDDKQNQPKIIKVISDRESHSIINSANNTHDRLILRILKETGCRPNSIANIRIGDLSELNGEYFLNLKYKFRGSKTPCKITKKLKVAIEQYINESNIEEGYLFETIPADLSLSLRTNRIRKRVTDKVKKVLGDEGATQKIFRTTKVNQILQECQSEICDFTRRKVGHKRKSKALYNYAKEEVLTSLKDRLANIVNIDSWKPVRNKDCTFIRDRKTCLQSTVDMKLVCPTCEEMIDDKVLQCYESYFPTFNTFNIDYYNIHGIFGSSFKIATTGIEEVKAYKMSLMKAMIIRNMTLTERNIFTPEAHCDIDLENFEPLYNELDGALFKHFRKYARLGIYPPIKVDWDKEQQFVVKATRNIPKNSIICEYTGIIYGEKVFESLHIDDDSTMYLDEEHIISPFSLGNIAKFISGINNKRKKNGNLASLCFKCENQPHVIIYAYEDIKKGSILNYDYNSGRKGNYPTDSFI